MCPGKLYPRMSRYGSSPASQAHGESRRRRRRPAPRANRGNAEARSRAKRPPPPPVLGTASARALRRKRVETVETGAKRAAEPASEPRQATHDTLRRYPASTAPKLSSRARARTFAGSEPLRASARSTPIRTAVAPAPRRSKRGRLSELLPGIVRIQKPPPPPSLVVVEPSGGRRASCSSIARGSQFLQPSADPLALFEMQSPSRAVASRGAVV